MLLTPEQLPWMPPAQPEFKAWLQEMVVLVITGIQPTVRRPPA
jgi:hypothetical protein